MSASSNQALFSAIHRDDLGRLQDALFDGADPNATSGFGDSAIGVAIAGDKAGCVEVLLRAGADPARVFAKRAGSILHLCVNHDASNSISALLGFRFEGSQHLSRRGLFVFDDMANTARLDPNYGTSVGNTPLHCAAGDGLCECVGRLLEHGALVNSRNTYGLTPLQVAAYGELEVLGILLAHGADVNSSGQDGADSALSNALLDGHPECAALLIDWGASLDIPMSSAATGSRGSRSSHDSVLDYAKLRGWDSVVAAIERRLLSQYKTPINRPDNEPGLGL